MGNENLRYYQFGEFKLDSRRRVLFKNGNRIDISAKNFELLYFLIQNEGRILTHDELLDAVWHGTFVEQSNLKKGISALRHLLEESPNESLYIRTIPRQGYSFVAAVSAIPDETDHIETFNRSQTEIFIEEVEEFQDEERPTLPGKISRSSIPIVIGIIVFVAVIGISVWYFSKKSSVRTLFDNPQIEKLTTDGNCYGKLSPDGNLVACIAKGKGLDVSIDLQQLVTGNRRKLVSFPNSEIYAIQFAPDGNFVYFVLRDRSDGQKSGVYKVSVLGGEAKFLNADAGSVVVASDGRIAFTRSGLDGITQIFIAGPDGQNERSAVSFSADHRLWDFRFSSENKALLCSLRKQISDVKNVFFVTEIEIASGRQEVVVPERDTLIASASWLPDRTGLILCIREPNADIRQIWQYFIDTGEMRRVTNDNVSYRDAAASKDGSSIAAVAESRQSGIWVGDGEGGKFSSLISGSIPIDSVFWARDGRLGYVAVENSSEIIRMTSLDGQSRVKITEGKDGYWISPALSADGTAISMISNRSGFQQLWKIDLDGKNPTQITTSESPLFFGYLLSGNVAIYRTFTTTGWSFFRQVQGQPAVKIDLRGTDSWSISPDEKTFAGIGEPGPDRPKTIVLQELQTGLVVREVAIKALGRIGRIKWTRDGRSVTYLLSHEGSSDLYQIQIDNGLSKRLTDFGADEISSFDWSFDSKNLAVVRGRVHTDTVVVRSTTGR